MLKMVMDLTESAAPRPKAQAESRNGWDTAAGSQPGPGPAAWHEALLSHRLRCTAPGTG